MTSTAPPALPTSTLAPTTTKAGPALQCNLNCYGDAATPVPLPHGDGSGIAANSVEACREFCLDTEGCEAIVFGQNMCYGKKDLDTKQCQPSDGTFKTEILTRMPLGTCVIMGDPHVLTFDNPQGHAGDITQLTAGDYHLVVSDELQIQGRFAYSERFPAEASMIGFAVTGDLVANNKLVVEYTGPSKGHAGFKAWWNDKQILTSFPGSYSSDDHFLIAKLDNIDPDEMHEKARHTIGGEVGSGALPSYLFQIMPDIRIYCLLGDDTMNAVIAMRRLQVAMDGYCGNFNCLTEDDTLEALEKRGLAGPVDGAKSLFGAAPQPPAEMEEKKGHTPSINDCSPQVMKEAEETCKHMQGGMRDGCIFDVCATGSEKVGAEDAAADALAMEVSEKFGFLASLGLPRLLDVQVSAQVQWAMGLLMVGLVVGGMAVGWTSRRRGAYSRVSVVEGDEARSLIGGGGSSSCCAADGLGDEEEALLLHTPSCEYEPIVAAA